MYKFEVREWLLYPNIMGSMKLGGGGSEGSRVHSNVINMIIAKRTAGVC